MHVLKYIYSFSLVPVLFAHTCVLAAHCTFVFNRRLCSVYRIHIISINLASTSPRTRNDADYEYMHVGFAFVNCILVWCFCNLAVVCVTCVWQPFDPRCAFGCLTFNSICFVFINFFIKLFRYRNMLREILMKIKFLSRDEFFDDSCKKKNLAYGIQYQMI